MKNGQEASDHDSLWIIDRDPNDPWFLFFDGLTQFELSRNIRKFQHQEEPWIFSAANYVPGTLILLADFSDSSILNQQKIWKNLGSPKTKIYSTEKSAFVKKFTAVSPESFHHIEELP